MIAKRFAVGLRLFKYPTFFQILAPLFCLRLLVYKSIAQKHIIDVDREFFDLCEVKSRVFGNELFGERMYFISDFNRIIVIAAVARTIRYVQFVQSVNIRL